MICPADYDLEDTYYYYDASQMGYLKEEARREGLEDVFILGSLEELEETVQADPGSMGVYFSDTGEAPQITILRDSLFMAEVLSSSLLSACSSSPISAITSSPLFY